MYVFYMHTLHTYSHVRTTAEATSTATAAATATPSAEAEAEAAQVVFRGRMVWWGGMGCVEGLGK